MDACVKDLNLNKPVALSVTDTDSDSPENAKRLPDPTYASVCFSVPTPIIENNNCSSVGLKVRDSLAPLNFLSEPEPTKSLALVS